MTGQHEPLTEAELYQDAIGCFYVAIEAIGEDVKAGRRELPECFRASREWGGE